MKYSVLGFNQEVVCSISKCITDINGKYKILTLDVVDLLIIQEIADFMNRKKIIKYTIEDKTYFSIKYDAIVDDLPILGIKKQALRDRIDKMCELGVIEKQIIKDGTGSWTAFRLGDIYEDLKYKPMEGVCSGLHTGMYSTTHGCVADYTPNDYNTITNNTITNNKEKEDKSSSKKKPKEFIPPTIQEVEAYIKEKGYNFSAKAFVDYYESDDWHYGKGANRKKVSNWKKCCATWYGNRNNNNDLFSQSSNSKEEDMMQKFLDLPDSEQAKILQLDAYQYHMLPASAKEGWMNNRKQFILQWFTENGQ